MSSRPQEIRKILPLSCKKNYDFSATEGANDYVWSSLIAMLIAVALRNPFYMRFVWFEFR